MSSPAIAKPVPHFPRAPLIAAAAMIVFTILAAVIGRLAHDGPLRPDATPLATRDLRFEDRADGAVTVLDADGTAVAVMAPGTNGFLRATLRGLARERHRSDLGADIPFRLTAWTEGGLTLQDLSTGRRVELEAFGPSNLEVFARLLPTRGATP